MKKVSLKSIQLIMSLIVAGLFFTSCNSASQNGSAEDHTVAGTESEEESEATMVNFDEVYSSINSLTDAYMVLKDALVASNAEYAQKAAGKLTELTDGEIKEAAEGIVASTDVKKQREFFNTISQKMYEMFKADESTVDAKIYKQYCPMAFNNEGAYWLSTNEEIMNPYFGDMMLHCGRVDETLEVASN
ncbi:DUF3347 domain-containing protein [Chondrinema litorale]|uniref:DUF3347 domain-containing protein n=1 Tax=Chondrinema litorale TaxID=2994555 RepID=UPI0025438FB7|nr:DUF3347 domain-containing protein [Chondrinema litorale]UZR93017.1 DUF3347 domain-containing protein [Chondrinema litorale]